MAHFFCPKKYVPGQSNSICVQTDPVSKKAVARNAVSGTEPQDFRQYPVDDLGIALGFFREIFVIFTMIGGIAFLYQKAAPSSVFLHILLLLSVIGAFANTSLFNQRAINTML